MPLAMFIFELDLLQRGLFLCPQLLASSHHLNLFIIMRPGAKIIIIIMNLSSQNHSNEKSNQLSARCEIFTVDLKEATYKIHSNIVSLVAKETGNSSDVVTKYIVQCHQDLLTY